MADKAQKIQHLGIIMDGNRRWARQHKFESVVKGHEKGGDKFIETCMWCQESQIPYLTVYAFSYDNWNRSPEEVEGIFELLESFFKKRIDTCIRRDIRLIPIGNMEMLSERSRNTLENAAKMTSHCKSLTVNIAISYGGHDETIRAAKKFAKAVLEGSVSIDDLNASNYKNYLDEYESPEMDLVIRTGGDKRLSGFFPWETSYAELTFLDVLWPDFSHEDFDNAIEAYYAKTRINKGK